MTEAAPSPVFRSSRRYGRQRERSWPARGAPRWPWSAGLSRPGRHGQGARQPKPARKPGGRGRWALAVWLVAFALGVYVSVGVGVAQAAAPDFSCLADGDGPAWLDPRAKSAVHDGSGAALASSSAALREGTRLFQARFDSAHWSGDLWAFALDADGRSGNEPLWRAAALLDAQHYDRDRVILSFNPLLDSPVRHAAAGRGVAFRFPADYRSPEPLGLSADQIAQLLAGAPHPLDSTEAAAVLANQAHGQALLDFLRGDRRHEGGGYAFRARASVLGDLDTDPRYVGAPLFPYPDELEAKAYSTFKAHYARRAAMVYVGGNDGMLHGFDASDGRERLAFVPQALFHNLTQLADPDYQHRYFVNAAPTVADAWLPRQRDPISGGSGAWRTVLVGGLGAGGQGMYALDVSDPEQFSEANASDIVLWEFDDGDDADLGFSFSVPGIARMADGRWAAVFGNGYHSTQADGRGSGSGQAVLFIVDLESGALIRKIDTGVGSSANPNGLASPALVDVDADAVVDFIYAGDLQGNLWKFDVRGRDSEQWDLAYRRGGVAQPLFQAGAEQPITTRPQVAGHPDGLGGYMVYFGSGKYLEADDARLGTAATQAFYGIWDRNLDTLPAFSKADLLRQTISRQYRKSVDSDGDGVDDREYSLREVSEQRIDFSRHLGWYLELRPERIEGLTNSANFGERQVSNALLRDGRVVFSTLLPAAQPCGTDASGYLMELDYRDGSGLTDSAFDPGGGEGSDHDGGEGADHDGGRVAAVLLGPGGVPAPSILVAGDRSLVYASGGSGAITAGERPVASGYRGRQSWRQLR